MSKIVTFFNDFQTLHARIVMFSLESLCQVSLKIRLLKIFDAISFYVTSKKLSKIRPAAAQCSCNLQKHSTILRDFMHTKNPAKKLPMWSPFFFKTAPGPPHLRFVRRLLNIRSLSSILLPQKSTSFMYFFLKSINRIGFARFATKYCLKLGIF